MGMAQARLAVKWLEILGQGEAARILSERIKWFRDHQKRLCLDRGFVELLDFMGDDLTVVNAARVSFAKERNEFVSGGGKGSDDGLIAFLARHQHWTPFGQPTVQFRIKMPLFVARQFMRSNIGIVYNETSRRYVTDPPEFYIPKKWRKKPDGSIKQGSGADIEDGRTYEQGLKETIKWAMEAYERALLDGVAPEMARMCLPQNMYTEFVCSMTLAAMIRVIGLRIDPHAQYEVKVYAIAMFELTKWLFMASISAHFPEQPPQA